MRIDIITVLPELIENPLNHSIIKRAKDAGIVEIHLHNLRDYSTDRHRKVDDYPFSGGAGMVLQVEPIDRAISALKEKRNYDEIIFTSPDGEKFVQKTANKLSTLNSIIILCGHYKGVDQRVRDHLTTMEISIGDYVMTGGELAAAVITDSVVRLLPGAISDESSALSDSFQDGLLSPPVYTRPSEYKGWKVPDILLSGNSKRIEEWKMQKAMERTHELRPDLLEENED
ncbi:MAG: tRNA (guanosine(37)-N1)-methyltransferase TrmD [Bacteroidota bacterium]